MEDFIDIDAPLPDALQNTTAPIELTSTTITITASTSPQQPHPDVPLTPQLPPLEAVPDSAVSGYSLSVSTTTTTTTTSTSTVNVSPSTWSSLSTSCPATSEQSSSFDPPVLAAPSSRFLDLLTPLRGRPSSDSFTSNADVISLDVDDGESNDADDDFRHQLQDYKRRKTEQSGVRATLSALRRGGEDFIDLKPFAAPSEPRPRPLATPSSSRSLSSSSSPLTAPWMTRSYEQPNFTLRLHEELLDFAAFVSPTASEEKARAALLARLTALIQSLFPSSSLAPFGSYATKLYIPMSDLDVVVFDTPELDLETGETALEIIAAALKREGWASYLEVISNARIPIVKFTDKDSGLKVDVCRDQTTGLSAAQYVSTMAVKFPAFRPLLLFLKYFLFCRKLNDTYTGGVGSYLLQLLVLSHLHHHPAQVHDVNLGLLLLSFLDLYGHQLNYETVGLSLTPPSYYSKEARARYNPLRPYLLSVENPLDVEHDVGVNSYCVMKVRRAFQYGFAQLTRKEVLEGAWRGSMLALLVRGAEEPVLRERGEKKRAELKRRRDKHEQQQQQQQQHGEDDDVVDERKDGHPSRATDDEQMHEAEDEANGNGADQSSPHAFSWSAASPSENRGRARTRDEISELVRWFEDRRSKWERMSSKEVVAWLKQKGLSKVDRSKLREYRRDLRSQSAAPREANDSNIPVSSNGAPDGSLDGDVEAPRKPRKRHKSKSQDAVRWYTQQDTEWMRMPIAKARKWLRTQQLTKAERTELDHLHPERGQHSKQSAQSSAAVDEHKDAEDAREEPSVKASRSSAAKKSAVAVRPAWLDFSGPRFVQYLNEEVVVPSVQLSMKKVWREERKRARAAGQQQHDQPTESEQTPLRAQRAARRAEAELSAVSGLPQSHLPGEKLPATDSAADSKTEKREKKRAAKKERKRAAAAAARAASSETGKDDVEQPPSASPHGERSEAPPAPESTWIWSSASSASVAPPTKKPTARQRRRQAEDDALRAEVKARLLAEWAEEARRNGQELKVDAAVSNTKEQKKAFACAFAEAKRSRRQARKAQAAQGKSRPAEQEQQPPPAHPALTSQSDQSPDVIDLLDGDGESSSPAAASSSPGGSGDAHTNGRAGGGEHRSGEARLDELHANEVEGGRALAATLTPPAQSADAAEPPSEEKSEKKRARVGVKADEADKKKQKKM